MRSALRNTIRYIMLYNSLPRVHVDNDILHMLTVSTCASCILAYIDKHFPDAVDTTCWIHEDIDVMQDNIFEALKEARDSYHKARRMFDGAIEKTSPGFQPVALRDLIVRRKKVCEAMDTQAHVIEGLAVTFSRAVDRMLQPGNEELRLRASVGVCGKQQC